MSYPAPAGTRAAIGDGVGYGGVLPRGAMMWWMLLVLAGCPKPDVDTDGGTDTDVGTGTDVGTDADADGYAAPTDCDDADPTVNPGAAEVCDGVDQDCDGVVDDGVPTDGAGCADPGAPTWDDAVDIVHLVVRTGDGVFNGTDDGAEVCLSDDACFRLDKPDWNDLEPGEVDVYAIEGAGLSRAALDRFTVRTLDGDDQWVPTCFQVALDGEPAYCREVDLRIGTDGDELPSWTDPDGLGQGCGTCFDRPLTHGPIVGAVGPNDARLWVRTDATRRVQVRVAPLGTPCTDAVVTLYPAASADFTAVAHVRGLEPSTVYAYDVVVDGVVYGPWTFATAPPAGAPGTLRLAFGSCTRDDDQPIFGTLSAYDPDLFLFVGDNHYGNTDHLGALRQHYRWAHERPLRAAFMADTPILATWDDHDFTGNNTDGTEPGKDTALRAFREYWANPSAGTVDTPGVFFAHAWGDVDIVMLDDRYWRGLDGMLGAGQEAWLLDTLEASTATFKLVASGSQWTAWGSGDSWAAFPDARARFLQTLVDRGIEGVVLLSGDVHRSEFRLLPGAPGGYDLPELTSSPLANLNSVCVPNAEVRACFARGDSFVGLAIDTTAPDPQLEATIVDTAGNVIATWTLHHSDLTLPGR